MCSGIFTIGHSNHSTEQLLRLLEQHSVTAVADVRSAPYSRYNPHFGKETLSDALREAGIAYVYLGRELGGRPDDPSCYVAGKVSYERVVETDEFQKGIERTIMGAEKYQIALLCAEKDPAMCHRTLLVAKELDSRGIVVKHILADGALEEHAATMRRIKNTGDLFGQARERHVSAVGHKMSATQRQEEHFYR